MLSQRTFSNSNQHSATDINVSLVKAFRNLVSGEDNGLSAAYGLFYKIVEEEQGAVRNATLAAVEQLQRGIHCYIYSCARRLAIDLYTKTIIVSTERLQRCLDVRITAGVGLPCWDGFLHAPLGSLHIL